MDMTTLLPDLRDEILAASDVKSSEQKLNVRIMIKNLRPARGLLVITRFMI